MRRLRGAGGATAEGPRRENTCSENAGCGGANNKICGRRRRPWRMRKGTGMDGPIASLFAHPQATQHILHFLATTQVSRRVDEDD